jgi:hypothetical protein
MKVRIVPDGAGSRRTILPLKRIAERRRFGRSWLDPVGVVSDDDRREE